MKRTLDLAQREATWRTRLGEQAQSGQSVAAYCRQQDISTATFYWWKARLARQAPGAELEPVIEPTPKSTPQPTPQPKAKPSSFIDLGALQSTPPLNSIGIRLELGNGMVLIIGNA